MTAPYPPSADEQGIQPPGFFSASSQVPPPPAADPVGEPVAQEDIPEPPPPAEEEEVTELTDEERNTFKQLLTVGRRTKTFDLFGHTVTVQSLRVSDDLRIGMYCRDHAGSTMAFRATQLATCAAGLQAIDGAPLYQPLTATESEDEIFNKKVEILKDYYPVTIEKIYRAIIELDIEFGQLLEKLGKLEG